MVDISKLSKFFPKISKPNLQAVVIAVVFLIVAIFVSVHLLHNSYESAALDLGLFSQTLKYTLQGDILYTTIDQTSFFADHFSPILLLLVPLYWLFPYVQMLLVIQVLALGLAAFLAYIMARSFGFSHRVSLATEILFCANPLLWGLILFDFHTISLAIPALMLMLIGMKEKRQIFFWIGFFIALMTKETIIILLGVFGFILLATKYIKEKKIDRQALGIFTISLLTYGIAILVAVAASGWEFPPKMMEYTSIRYGYLDQPLYKLIRSALNVLLSTESVFMLVAYLLPFGLLPLFSLKWATAGIFILISNMLASYADQRIHFLQYAAPALPFLFIAFIDSLSKIRDNPAIQKFLSKLTPRLGVYFFEILFLVAIIFNVSPSSSIWKVKLPDAHDRATDQVISFITDGKTVTASNKIFPHICDRTDVYMPHWFGRASVYDEDIVWGYPERLTDYVIIDWTKSNMTPNGPWEGIVEDHIYEDYDSVIKIDDIELYRLR